MFTQLVGRLMGVENLQSIHSIRLSLAAPWAESGPAWVLFGCAALAALAIVFYSRWQPRGRKGARTVLAVSRSALLILMLLILADPVLKLELTNRPRPLLWVLFDGTQSMEIQDEMPDADRARLTEAVGLSTSSSKAVGQKAPVAKDAAAEPASESASQSSASARPSRLDYLKALVARPKDNLLVRLEKEFRVQYFIMDRPDSVRELQPAEPPRTAVDPAALSQQLTAKGQVTAIGTALDDLIRAAMRQRAIWPG